MRDLHPLQCETFPLLYYRENQDGGGEGGGKGVQIAGRGSKPEALSREQEGE